MRARILFTLLASLVATPVAAQDADTRVDLSARLEEGDHALTAADVVRMAIEHSPRVEVARITVTAAEASVRRATVQLVPRLELTARYAHVDGFPDGRIGGNVDPAMFEAARTLAGTVTDPSARTLFLGFIDSQETSAAGVTIRIPRDQFGFAARLTVPLSDLFFAVLPALHGAEARVRAEELRRDVAARDVELAALEAYYRYAEARGVLAVASAGETRVGERVAMVEALLRGGVLTPPDLAVVQAAQAQAHEGVARAEGAVALTRVALGVLIGDDGTGALSVSAALTPPGAPEGDVATLEAEALDTRPELRALREAIEAQRSAREATLAGGYPHLGVYLGGDVSNPSARIIPPRDEFVPVWEVGAVLTWSPNDLATSIFAAEEIDASVARAEAEILLAEDAVRLELRQAYEARLAARSALEAAEAARASAEVAYEARRAQLAAGEGLLDDVSAADLRVTETQLAELRARLEAATAEARLRHALGLGLTD